MNSQIPRANMIPAGNAMTSVPKTYHADYAVVGSGVAGLRAAIELSSAGTVLVLAKSDLSESATAYAQGGIAVALSDEDEIGLHEQDTLAAGDGLCRPQSVALLVEEGPKYITQLIEWGTEFDRAGTKLAFTREAAHSRSRILHAHGDSTGREISRALLARAHALPHLHLRAHAFTTGLIVENGRVCGLRFLDETDGSFHEVRAGAVLLATGGLGQLYRETTNPAVATGDGMAIAYEAGAVLSDMEFVQFHPTALAIKDAPRFLLSEALRGGAGTGAARCCGSGHCQRDASHQRAARLFGYDGKVRGISAKAFSTHLLHVPELRSGLGHRHGSGMPRGALHDGRSQNGFVRTHFGSRALRRWRNRRYRRTRCQPVGQQFPSGRLGIWRPGRPRHVDGCPGGQT